jgi:hypothetical protein
MGMSLGKNRAGVLLILFGVGGVDGGLFSHPSGGVCTRGVCRGGGYGSSREETSISQSLREGDTKQRVPLSCPLCGYISLQALGRSLQ